MVQPPISLIIHEASLMQMGMIEGYYAGVEGCNVCPGAAALFKFGHCPCIHVTAPWHTIGGLV